MKQENTYIEELVTLFFEGLTTNRQEKELYMFFSKENIPDNLQVYQPFFEALGEDGILTKIEKSGLSLSSSPLRKKVRFVRWVSIAASVVIFLLVTLKFLWKEEFILPIDRDYVIQDGKIITDEEIILRELQKTMEASFLPEEEMERFITEISRNHPHIFNTNY